MLHLNKIINSTKKLPQIFNSEAVFTAFDTESTELSPSKGRIIEIGAIKFNKEGVISTWSSLFNPYQKLSSFIIQLTNISQQMVDSAPPINEKLDDFLSFIQGTILIAHNAQADLNFLNVECMNAGKLPAKNRFIDTLRLSQIVYPEAEYHKLEFLADYLSIDKGSSHRALDDAITCQQLFLKMIEKIDYCNKNKKKF
ncbi:MAG: 3'-5' exonuclease [Treponema sp.]|nr:3'-5' exonuclease [Treponema sp.]